MLYGRGGEDLVNGGPAAGQAAAEDYTRPSLSPAVRTNMIPNWDWAGAVERRRASITGVGRELADGPGLAQLVPGAEFRAIRDTLARRDQ